MLRVGMGLRTAIGKCRRRSLYDATTTTAPGEQDDEQMGKNEMHAARMNMSQFGVLDANPSLTIHVDSRVKQVLRVRRTSESRSLHTTRHRRKLHRLPRLSQWCISPRVQRATHDSVTRADLVVRVPLHRQLLHHTTSCCRSNEEITPHERLTFSQWN